MSYNTFANEVDANEVGTNEVDTSNECIICLEKTPIDGKDHITLMNEMHFLIKKCDCLCYVHHKCLEKWIGTNAVCPICKGEISFPLMPMKNKDFIIDLRSIQSDGIQNIDAPTNPVSSHFCIRMIILMFFILTILQIVFRN